MKWLEDLAMNVWMISVTCSVVLVPLLLLAPKLQKRVAARSFHILFFLMALRLLIPVRLTLPEPVVTVEAPTYVVAVPQQAPERSAVTPSVSSAPVPVQAAPAEKIREIPVTLILSGVWLIGAAACLSWGIGSYLWAKRRILRYSTHAGENELQLLSGLAGELGIQRLPSLLKTSEAAGPMMLGLFHPAIILPKRDYDLQSLGFIFRHELTHLRRGDVWYKGLLNLSLAVHWFNPLVWLMSRAAGRNLELCCDDEVAGKLPQSERCRYGSVLLDAAQERRTPLFSTNFGGGKKQLKARLTNLFTQKKTSRILVCLVLGCALLIGGLVACESGNAASSERLEQLRAYLNDHYEPENTSIALADLTGDGLDEMIVVTMQDLDETPLSLRETVRRDLFYSGTLEVYGMDGEEVTPFYRGGVDISMTGAGRYELVTRPDGSSALLVIKMDTAHPASGDSFSYQLLQMDETGQVNILESGEASAKEEFLAQMDELRQNPTALLVYDVGLYDNFAYIDTPPDDIFAGESPNVVAVTQGMTQPIREATQRDIENRRALLKEYFDQNLEADDDPIIQGDIPYEGLENPEEYTSVILADLTGDGLEEMIVLYMTDTRGNGNPVNLRQAITSSDLAWGGLDIYGVNSNEEVVRFVGPADWGVSTSHVGWGYYYLVPLESGGQAILHFTPYIGMGLASYSYELIQFDDSGHTSTLDTNGVLFSIINQADWVDKSDNATIDEVKDFLARVEYYRTSGQPLIMYNEGSIVFYEGSEIEQRDYGYWNSAPEDAFNGINRGEFVGEEHQVHFTLPVELESSEAVKLLMDTLPPSEGTSFMFLMPFNFYGDWDIQIYARTSADAENDFKPAEYTKSGSNTKGIDDWIPGGRCFFTIGEDSHYTELRVDVTATSTTGVTATGSVTLPVKEATDVPIVDDVRNPEFAIQYLGNTIGSDDSGAYTFQIPEEFEGEWNIHIAGRVRIEWDNYMSVHFLEGTTWGPGETYSFDPGIGYYDELTMEAQATAPNGEMARRSFPIIQEGYKPQSVPAILKRTATSFIIAYFSDEPESMAEYLEPGANVETYGSNVMEQITEPILQFDEDTYDQPEVSAVYRFRLNGEDSYTYLNLTMRVDSDEGGTVLSYSLEK